MKHSTKLGTIALVCIAMAFFAACKKKDKKDDNIAKDKDGRVCGMSATMEARVCEDGSYAVFAKDGTCALICPEDNQNLGTDTATSTSTVTNTVTATATATSTLTDTAIEVIGLIAPE